MRALGQNAALLAVDMQKGFDDPGWGFRNNPMAQANVAALLAAWRAATAPVIHVHHDSPDPRGPLWRTGDQRFFLAFAQRWRKSQTDAALRKQIATDTHAPGEYRADTVRNLEAWVRAYDVKPGDRLYLPPEARFQIW